MYRRTTAKINEVKSLVESAEQPVEDHLKYHEDEAEHTHIQLENRIGEDERRFLDMIVLIDHFYRGV